MHRSILSLALLAGVPAAVMVGCSTAPKSVAGQQDLQREADRRLDQALSLDPSLRPVLDRSAGYAVFPVVGEGGFVLGGGYGKGALYERGQFKGFVDITSVSGGLKIGGQQYSQMIVFETPEPLANFKNGNFKLSADASAVALRSGVAATTDFKDNVQVYIWDQAGLMADASIGAQTFRYTPADDAAQAAGGSFDYEADSDKVNVRTESHEYEARPAGQEIDTQKDHTIQQQNREIDRDQRKMELRTETEFEQDAQPAGAKIDTPTKDADWRDNYRTTPDGNLNRGSRQVDTQQRDVDVQIDSDEVDVDVQR